MAGWGVAKVVSGFSMTSKIMIAGAATVLVWGVSKLLFRKTVPDYILNFDGLKVYNSSTGGAGCVIRDKEGELIVAAAYNLDDCSHVELAEATALQIGMELAKEHNIKLGLIQGDSFETIQHVRVPDIISFQPTVPSLRDLIQEIRCAFNEQSIDPETHLRLTIREKNEVAHELALLGCQLPQGRIYARGRNVPPKIATLIRREKLVWDIWLRIACEN